MLAWAIVEGENLDSWSYLMHHLKTAIPETMKSTIMSDRDKGLISAEEILGPGIFRAHCCFHIRENFKTRFGIRLTEKYFWSIAESKTPYDFNTRLQQLRFEKAPAAEYLEGINRELWVTAFFPGKRYGHHTSNIVESLNKTFVFTRELPILDLLNEIWHSQMELRWKRWKQVNNPEYHFPFTQLCNTEFETSRIWAQSNSVRTANFVWAEVRQRVKKVESDGDEKTHIVNCTYTPIRLPYKH